MDSATVKQRMHKSVQALKEELLKIRTGRAHPGMLDHVKVACYGQEMPLNQTSTVAVAGNKLLTVSPWDSGNLVAIEKAVRDADLGVNPSNDGEKVLVNLPELSEDRRKELVKLVKREAENAKIAVRNIRRDELGTLKEMMKSKEISENELRRDEKNLQQVTDESVSEIDDCSKAKSDELMKV